MNTVKIELYFSTIAEDKWETPGGQIVKYCSESALLGHIKNISYFLKFSYWANSVSIAIIEEETYSEEITDMWGWTNVTVHNLFKYTKPDFAEISRSFIVKAAYREYLEKFTLDNVDQSQSEGFRHRGDSRRECTEVVINL